MTSSLPVPGFPAAAPASGSRASALRAFTLLEIMVALTILGLLVALVVTKLGGTLDSARVQTAKLFVNDSLKTPLFTYKMQLGDFPTTEEGLQALIASPASKADRWQGPYVEVNGNKLPLDPWGNPYQYRYPGTHNKGSYDLWSTGPEGTNAGEDKVIGNW